jgi:hypothetical protein
MPKIKVLRGNTSSLANYAGSAGEIALNYETGNLMFWTNTANVYYTLAGAAAGGGGVSPFQGSIAGYTIGGTPSYPTLTGDSTIQKFTFSSGSPASNIGSFPSGQWVNAGGASSDSYGYIYGGYKTNPSSSNYNDNLDKHPFSSDSPGSNVQTISPSTVPLNRLGQTGHQSLSTGYAYWPSHPGEIKMPFASDTDAVTYTSDLGYAYTPSPLQVTSHQASGSTSTENRYKSGGYQPNVPFAGYFGLMRNPFSSDNAIILGSLVWPGYYSAGVSGETAGYAIGGMPNYNSSASTPSPTIYDHDNIQKYSFSSDGNATDVGQLAQSRNSMAGYSSTTDGYVTGGINRPVNGFDAVGLDHIYKFPFSSESTVTDQAELVTSRFLSASTQV